MASKELGMIHSVNKSFQIPASLFSAGNINLGRIDLPGELTEQLQTMVRAGNYFKTVGIDLTLSLGGGGSNHSSSISGEIRYFVPTKGRCAAFRSAFKSMADLMKMQGISMRDNHLYDFKPALNDRVYLPADLMKNQATLDGTNGLSLITGETVPEVEGTSIFGVHNSGVQPVTGGGDIYSEGFKTLLDSSVSRTDFVLNDVQPYTGNSDFASEEYETIPFQLAFSTTADERATATFQWRPDPALYVAIMCGQMEIHLFDNSSVPSTDPFPADLNVSVMVSGWKSIMGNPDKKKSSKKRLRK